MTEEAALKNYKPLYLKYRPQSLEQLVGQQAAVRTLTNAIECDRLSHAYLFTGPRGTGKTSTARILAKSLNCAKGPTTTPCGQCTQCLEIKEGTCTAVFELDAASNNSVDDARVLIERAPLVAVGGRFKIYIIDECHMLTKEAFNALLKTIEEPPPGVIFVLATTEEHKVPQTIVSRCQKLMFRLVSGEELSKYLKELAILEAIEIDDEALNVIARRSGGGLRDALGLLDQASLLAAPGKPVGVNDLLNLLGAVHEDALIEISLQVLNRQGEQVLATTNRLLMEGREPAVVAQELALHFLNLTKASYILDGADAGGIKKLIVGSPKYLSELTKQAPHFERAELAQMVEKLNHLENTCRRTTQPALHLEMGLLSLCHRHDILIVKDMEERIKQLELAVTGDMSGIKAYSAGTASGTTAKTTSAPASAASSQAVHAAPANVTNKAAKSDLETTAELPALTASAVDTKSTSNDNSVQAPHESATHPDAISPVPSANIVSESPAATPQASASQLGAASSSPAAPASPAASNDTNLKSITIAPASTSAPKVEAKQGATSGDEVSPFDLEVAWEQLMELLNTRHTPTFSLLTQHAFPVSLTSKELTVGIYAGHFQKLLEDKVTHIKSAADTVLSRPITVKIKVMGKDTARPAATPRASQQPAAKAEVVGSADDDEAEPASASAPRATATTTTASANATTAASANATTAASANATAAASANATTAASASTATAVAATMPASSATDTADLRPAANKVQENETEGGGTHDPGLIKEAYKLFDGPGSRHIT